jgi:hypothetical protein
MLPFILYLITAVVTGFHLYSLLSLAVYGVPFNLFELVCLLGSFCLMIAAYVSLFKPHAAARVALIACLLMWSFYGPALAKIVRNSFGKPATLSHSLARRPSQSRNYFIGLGLTVLLLDSQ